MKTGHHGTRDCIQGLVRSILSIALVVVLSGCEAVFTRQPLGDEAVSLDRAIWQGTWLSDEVVLLTTVLDGEKGQLQAAWMERGSSGAEFETVVGSVRRTGEIIYLSMVHAPAAEAETDEKSARQSEGAVRIITEYFWARIDNDGRRAVLWWPEVEHIRLAVADGRLPGLIKEDRDVILGRLESTHLDLLNSPASGMLRWSQPLTFIRIGD